MPFSYLWSEDDYNELQEALAEALGDIADLKKAVKQLQGAHAPPVPEPPPGPPTQPPAGPGNAYFDAHKGAAIFAKGYRNQAAINEDTASTLRHGQDIPHFTYYRIANAAMVHFGENVGTLDTDHQIRSKFQRVASGKLIFVWDWKFSSEWKERLGQLQLLKSFQLANTTTAPNFIMSNGRLAGREMQPGTRRIELRHWWVSKSWSPVQLTEPNMAWCDVRADYVDNSDSDLGASMANRTYQLAPGIWQRWWAEVNFDTRTLNVWIADERTDPVQIYRDLYVPRLMGLPVPESNGLDWFWLEFHGTQPRVGPASVFGWYRNLMVFHNHTPPLERPVT